MGGGWVILFIFFVAFIVWILSVSGVGIPAPIPVIVLVAWVVLGAILLASLIMWALGHPWLRW